MISRDLLKVSFIFSPTLILFPILAYTRTKPGTYPHPPWPFYVTHPLKRGGLLNKKNDISHFIAKFRASVM